MRVAVVLVLVSLALLVAPTGMPHEGSVEFGHLNVDVRTLAPGESRNLHVNPDEGPLREGWVFVVYGLVNGTTPLVVNLTHEKDLVHQWNWTAGNFERHFNTTRLHADGAHELTLWNPSSDQSIQYGVYYDMSCQCAGKPVPLPGGSVLFNFDIPAGQRASIDLPVQPGARVRASLATLEGTGASWPEDFKILEEKEAGGGGWTNFTVRPDAAQRYYLMGTVVEGASLREPVDLTPLVGTKAARSPGPTAVASLVGILAVALAAGALRRT